IVRLGVVPASTHGPGVAHRATPPTPVGVGGVVLLVRVSPPVALPLAVVALLDLLAAVLDLLLVLLGEGGSGAALREVLLGLVVAVVVLAAPHGGAPFGWVGWGDPRRPVCGGGGACVRTRARRRSRPACSRRTGHRVPRSRAGRRRCRRAIRRWW